MLSYATQVLHEALGKEALFNSYNIPISKNNLCTVGVWYK